MQGICLKVFVAENQRRDGKILYEWLLEKARAMGVHGGTALRAIAGFGRHGRLHEETFFELSGDLPVEVEFLLDEAQAAQFLAMLVENELKLFYVKMPAEYGVVG